MADVCWLEQSVGDVPAEDDWLGASERDCLRRLRFAKRRADWRLGRWTAKLATAAYLRMGSDWHALRDIEIQASVSGAPEVVLAGKKDGATISISHRDGIAMCAVAPHGTNLGCDLEMIEPHSEGFVADYFTAEERAFIEKVSGGERWALLALLWSAKESALKALHEGLREDTRDVAVDLGGELHFKAGPGTEGTTEWAPFSARCVDGVVLHGWWQQAGRMLRTLVASPPADSPTFLMIAGQGTRDLIARHI